MTNGNLKRLTASAVIGKNAGSEVRVKGLVLTSGTGAASSVVITDDTNGAGTPLLTVRSLAGETKEISLPFRLSDQGYATLAGAGAEVSFVLE